ncbi:MAG TPA: hypothetical protein VJ792_09385 [Candidatus Nitrosotalea sp.]|nr:hypothetical protein [Candidatus Nitrosotalea sp.]
MLYKKLTNQQKVIEEILLEILLKKEEIAKENDLGGNVDAQRKISFD